MILAKPRENVRRYRIRAVERDVVAEERRDPVPVGVMLDTGPIGDIRHCHLEVAGEMT